MAANVKGFIKLLLVAGKATASGPLSAAFGSKGAGGRVKDFCTKFNEETKGQEGVRPVVVYIYDDNTISCVIKHEPVSKAILRILGKDKGSPRPNQTKIGTLTLDQVNTIAKDKIVDLNARALEKAVQIVSGTARSMGVDIVNS